VGRDKEMGLEKMGAQRPVDSLSKLLHRKKLARTVHNKTGQNSMGSFVRIKIRGC